MIGRIVSYYCSRFIASRWRKVVFIGLKKADLLQGYLVTYLLESRGIPCWLYDRNKELGFNHRREEGEVIRGRARGYVLIITPAALVTPDQLSTAPDDGNIRSELQKAREVLETDKRDKRYRVIFVMDNVDAGSGLRETWIEHDYGRLISQHTNVQLNYSAEVQNIACYENWIARISNDGPAFRTSEEAKLVRSLQGRAQIPCYAVSPTLADLDYCIRNLLQPDLPILRPIPHKPLSRVAIRIAILVGIMALALWFLLPRPTPSPGIGVPPSQVSREAEIEAGGLEVRDRGNASGKMTARVYAGKAYEWQAIVSADAFYDLEVVYANDSDPDELTVTVDGAPMPPLTTRVTGNGGRGWNEFVSDRLPVGRLAAGRHNIVLGVASTREDGIELDRLVLHPRTE